MRNRFQNLFLVVLYCFRLFGEFGKVFFRGYICIVQRTHFLSCLLGREATTIFTIAKGLLASCVFFQHVETLHGKNKIDKEF